MPANGQATKILGRARTATPVRRQEDDIEAEPVGPFGRGVTNLKLLTMGSELSEKRRRVSFARRGELHRQIDDISQMLGRHALTELRAID